MRFLLALIILSSGCAAYRVAKVDQPPLRPDATPPQGMAQVCVYRAGWPANAVVIAVRDNGLLVGGTRGGGYFCYYAQPGVHRIVNETPDEKKEIVLEAKGDTRYYLDQNAQKYFGVIHTIPTWDSDGEGLREISNYEYQLLTSAPDDLPPRIPRARAARE